MGVLHAEIIHEKQQIQPAIPVRSREQFVAVILMLQR